MYAIMDSSGTLGKSVAGLLLANGFGVRIVTRKSAGLESLVAQGAEMVVGSFYDLDFLAEAFSGTRAVFTILPLDIQDTRFLEAQQRMSTSVSQAVGRSNAKKVVNVSAVGVGNPAIGGIIRGLSEQEQRLNEVPDIDVVHVRAAYFMENLLWFVPEALKCGVFRSPFKESVSVPMVASSDVSGLAATLLYDLDFTGKTYHRILGERTLSIGEIVTILKQVLGMPELSYESMDYHEAEAFFAARGCSPAVSEALVRLHKDINEEELYSGQERTASTSAETPFEEFAAYALTHQTEKTGQVSA